ncbi:DUF4817 domain-containing protein [Nephila pilipes]|uniref:DUF4817 domain-containing protein n=1 Tax=Nephila pilipes TaxID=299642 RepID=A0A8X6P2Y7_NEPPI|nr:DUF4817 domain-containing protein [Nephila pilipes]
MLSGKDKALSVMLFYMNEESATVALRKFRLQKNMKTGKGPLTVAGLTNRNGTLASESSAGTSSAREAGTRLGLPPSLIRNILHGVLNQYPYKLQSCHKLLPSIP